MTRGRDRVHQARSSRAPHWQQQPATPATAASRTCACANCHLFITSHAPTAASCTYVLLLHVQEEVEVKTRKLKKLWGKYQAAQQEIGDLQVMHEKKRRKKKTLTREGGVFNALTLLHMPNGKEASKRPCASP
jgi:hypothetical protein